MQSVGGAAMTIAQVVLLTVTLITPNDRPDVTESHKMPSAEACWRAAQAWLEQDAHKLGYLGLAARCARLDDPDDKGEDG